MPDEREHAALREIVDGLFPVGPRACGTIYDGYIGNLDLATYPFESLTVPTLVVAAEDDTLAPYKDSRAMAERIPGARFVTVRRGGHTLTQLDAGAHRAVAEFIGAAGRDRGARIAGACRGRLVGHARLSLRRRVHGPLDRVRLGAR